jgi:pimeloyl-ACP methyl ester carboxylesterase
MTTLVLLPGMDGTGMLFANFIAEYAGDTLVISYPADLPLGYDELEQYILQRLPTDKPFILVGESFSGPLAISLAAKKLPLLRGLVLVCTFVKLPGPNMSARLKEALQRVPIWHAPLALSAALLGGRFMTPSIRHQLARALESVSPAAWRARLQALLTVDVSSALRELTLPMLYLRATKDRVVFRSASERILSLNNRVAIVDIEAPHLLLQTQPHQAVAAVHAFVESMQ